MSRDRPVMPQRYNSNLVHVRTEDESSEDEVYDEYTANTLTHNDEFNLTNSKPLFPQGLMQMHHQKMVQETVNPNCTTVILNYDSVKTSQHAEYNQYRSRNKDVGVQAAYTPNFQRGRKRE